MNVMGLFNDESDLRARGMASLRPYLESRLIYFQRQYFSVPIAYGMLRPSCTAACSMIHLYQGTRGYE